MTWTAVTGAAQYRVIMNIGASTSCPTGWNEASYSPGSNYCEQYVSASNTSWDFPTTVGYTYGAWLRSVSPPGYPSGAQSGASNLIQFDCPAGPPPTVSAACFTGENANITWNAVSGAGFYQVIVNVGSDLSCLSGWTWGSYNAPTDSSNYCSLFTNAGATNQHYDGTTANKAYHVWVRTMNTDQQPATPGISPPDNYVYGAPSNVFTFSCTPSGGISLNPNPIQVCNGATAASTTISSTANVNYCIVPSATASSSPTGPTFECWGANTSHNDLTPRWVTNGMYFYLIQSDTKAVLGHTSASFTNVGCPAPDLTAGSVTPIFTIAGSATDFSAPVSNIGATSTGSGFSDLFQVADDSVGTNARDIGTYSSSALAANSSNRATLTYTFPTAGTYWMRVCADKRSAADVNGVIHPEANENNNCGGWTKINIGTQCGVACYVGATSSGSSLTLSWGTSNAVSATIDNGVGSVATGTGSKTIAYPTATTTYTMTATGAGGSCIATCKTTQIGPPSNVYCSPATQSVPSGGTATWTASGGTSPYTWFDNVTNTQLGSGTTFSKSYTTDGSVYVKDSTGKQSTTCSVTTGTCGALSDTITATPDRLPSGGGTTHVTWTATGVQSSCVITRDNAIIKTIIANSCSIGTDTVLTPDPTVTTQTTFCITCDGNTPLKACKTVNVGNQFRNF